MENNYQDNLAIQTQRRKYPTDQHGLKSEWWGIEQHLAEISEDIRRNERDIINLRKKELLTELDRKILEQLQLRQDELEMKQFEAQEMIRRKQAFDEEQRKYLQDRQLIQKGMQNVYDKQKQESILRDLDERARKLEWERIALEENRKRMHSEAMKRRMQKQMWAKDIEDDLKQAEIKQNEQRQRQQIDQIEIQELNRRNAEREIIKEENYKNFYRMCAENQSSLQKLHIDNVMKPLIERQNQLEALIAKNVDIYQKKLLQEELNRVIKRQQEYQQTMNQNRQMMAEHDQIREYDRVEREQKNKQRLEDLNNYNQYVAYKKFEQNDRQRQYKDFLDQQKREKDELRLKQERMGRPEKGMNRLDLESYKSAEPQLHSLLPGWAPQVGQLPPKLNNLARKNNSLVQLKQNEQDTVNNNYSVIQNQEFKNTRGETFKAAAQYTMNPQQQANYVSNHNPVTNPNPFNNQNPYIRKQQEQFLMGKFY